MTRVTPLGAFELFATDGQLDIEHEVEPVPADEAAYISVPEPGGAPRPLWYRVSALLEPLRPAFAWAVAHDRVVKSMGLAVFAILGSVLSFLAGQKTSALLARRRR